MKKQEQNYRVPQVSDSTVGKVRKLAADVEALTVSQAETKHKVAGATLGHHQVRWHFFLQEKKSSRRTRRAPSRSESHQQIAPKDQVQGV